MSTDGNSRTLHPDCPQPVRRAVMKQKWLDLAYLHWRVDPAAVARLLPDGLEVDTFDGDAWVGLVPFSMRGIGVPGLPAVPWLGSFPEINVRTYVIRNGVPGVWFLSLDVNRFLPALVARVTYRLPYCWGRASNRVDGNRLESTVHRHWPSRGAQTSLSVDIGGVIEQQSALEVFLTARWGLYSRGPGGRLMYAPVDHPRWVLHRATPQRVDDTLVVAAGLPVPVGEPHCMFSPGVPVRIGLPRRVTW
ncbi:MAG: YqjF family protein [Acidimicrobiales bacterium]